MEARLDYGHIWKWGDVPSRAGAKHFIQKRSFFQPIRCANDHVSYCFAPQTKAIFFLANQVSYCFRASSKRFIRCFLDLSSFQSGTMPPAVIYYQSDFEVQQQYHRPDDEDLPGGEIWDEELVDPGGLVYVGQGQAQYLRVNEVHPGMVWPKRKKKKKKKK